MFDQRRLQILEEFLLQMCFAYGAGLLFNINSLYISLCYHGMKLVSMHLVDVSPGNVKTSCMISENSRFWKRSFCRCVLLMVLDSCSTSILCIQVSAIMVWSLFRCTCSILALSTSTLHVWSAKTPDFGTVHFADVFCLWSWTPIQYQFSVYKSLLFWYKAVLKHLLDRYL